MNKSYIQFSLTTLQLIIPLSTMTKAEYKETYGIDLDDIDIERVTLLQEEGSKNKYFVDEVKTTENGVDIYAGGKVLSIGSSVSVVNNAYSVGNAKPIYFHGVGLTKTGLTASRFLNLHILNNSPTPFTLATFKAWAESISGLVEIAVSGVFKIEDQSVCIPTLLRKNADNTWVVFVCNGSDNSPVSINFDNTFDIIGDAVNKIN